MDNIWYVVIYLAVSVGAALLCAKIASGKGRSPAGYGILGFLIPLLGLIVVGVVPSRVGQASA
jgi:hypothetical protein